VLRAHPALWNAYPDGDLSGMPARLLWELFMHARAEQTDAAREHARELAVVLAKMGGVRL
jgi:hypothetical protein